MNDAKVKDASKKFRLFSYLMDHIPDVIYFKDRKGRLMLVNKAHAAGLGVAPEAVVGKTDFDLFPRERAARMAADDRQVFRTGKAIYDKIERATRPDGVDNYVTTTKIPLRDGKGKIIGLVGITRDITRRMQFERLRKQKVHIENKLEALEELNTLKSEFVSAVSHELRTPLAIIQQLIGIFASEASGPLNSKQKEIVARVAKNIERLKKIVEELLDLSRIERKTFQLHYSLINLNALLRESSQFFETLAREKGMRLAYDLPEEEVNIFIDVDRIYQVLSNLMNNAINYSEPRSTTKIEMKVLASKVRIGFIDSGIGIAKEDIPKIFDKFVQVAKKEEAVKKGIGLGLAIAKDLVERHGGEMWVESQLGVGSKFYFTLPRFLTAGLFESRLQHMINAFLRKGISVQFINLVLVDYEAFRERAGVKPKKVFDDFEAIIRDVLKESCRTPVKIAPTIIKDIEQGKCNIIVPGESEDAVKTISSLLRDRLKRYFIEHTIENTFLALGVLSCSKMPSGRGKKQPPAFCDVKQELYVGSEMRRFKRMPYQTNCTLFFPGKTSDIARTIDISEGGICVVAEQLVETDSYIRIRLALLKNKKRISLRTRVAWIKEAEPLQGEMKKRYKLGLEFIDLTKAQKKTILRELQSLSASDRRHTVSAK